MEKLDLVWILPSTISLFCGACVCVLIKPMISFYFVQYHEWWLVRFGVPLKAQLRERERDREREGERSCKIRGVHFSKSCVVANDM